VATALENLLQARESLIAKIAEATANPRPTYSLDGQSFDWTSYLGMLTDQLVKLDEAIMRAQAPWQVKSRGRF
jgi:hypothetical protein